MTQTNPPVPVPTVNKPAQEVVTIIEDLVEKGEEAAEIAIIAQAPWMGTPVWKQIWEALFDWLVKLVMRPVASLGGRVVISIEEYVALKNAARAQADLDAAKKTGDSNAISQASSKVDDAVASVVHYVGATRS